MHTIVIGLGSMGRRRARLLKQYDDSVDIIGVDTQEERRAQAEKELAIKTAESIDAACRNIEGTINVAFVSTSPLSHAAIIKECLERGFHVFTELNLIDVGYTENIELAEKKHKILFLSSTFLYRKEVQYIKEAALKSNCPLTYTYHVGQYLSDWHPWESYKGFFIGDKATNGCRELMAIELPWIIDTFGNVERIDSLCSRNSSLEIDFPDSYQIMIEHGTGHRGVLSIDVVSRKAVRNLELWGENLYLTWNGTPDGLLMYDYETRQEKSIILYDTVDKRDDYSASIIEDAYMSEIDNFIKVVRGEEQPRYSFGKDKTVLDIIDNIERK